MFYQFNMPRAKYDFEPPVEGWNKKTLPLIPGSDLLQPVPLRREHGKPSSGRYVSIHTRPKRSGKKTKAASDPATDAVMILQSYNRYVGLLRESEDDEQRQLSGRFVELGKGITAAIVNAEEEVRSKLVEMEQVSRQMFQRLELEDAYFANGSWARMCIYTTDTWVRWLTRCKGLSTNEFREKLKSIPSTNLGHLVELASSSFEQAFDGLNRLFVSNFYVMLEHVLTLPDGQRLAVDLCLGLDMSGVLLLTEMGEGRRISSAVTTNLHFKILDLLGLLMPSRHDNRFEIWHHFDIDVAAIKRRLWSSMEERGCRKTGAGSRREGKKDCVCHRRASLGLLHYLQILAHGQIRAKIFLTIGRVLAAELCSLILEFAMIAEEIPSDPRVWRYSDSRIHHASFRMCKEFQVVFEDEFRCPRFKACNRKRLRGE